MSVFENLTTYKNRNGGIWGRGEMHHVQEREVRRQRHGLHARGWRRWASTTPHRSSTRCSWAKPRTSAIPQTAAEKAYGRTFPKPTMPDFPIRGYEYYDYRHDVVNTTFRNYEDNATRKTGAISHLLYTSFGASSNNAIENAEVHQRQAGVLPADGEASGATTMVQAAWPTRPPYSRTRTARSALAPIPTWSSTTASTTASRSTPKPARSSPPGTPRYARAMSDA